MLYNSIKYKKGRGAQLNTANKYLKQYTEADLTTGDWFDTDFQEDNEYLPTQFFFDYPKSIVNKVDSDDLPMFYSLNPYAGCEHGCSYCYARNIHENWGYSAGTDFEQKIIVKRGVTQLLEQYFMKKNYVCMPISLSGNTDCYQPAERKFQLTRACLQVFLNYKNPVGIITKNALIYKDIDILKKLAALQLVQVFVSLNTLNDDLRQKMEPRASSVKTRLQVIEKLAQAGIPVTLMASPIIPGLNDTDLPQLYKKAAELGAQSASYSVVRLNGAVGEIFRDWIIKNYPNKAEKVLHQIAEMHGGKINDSQFGRRMRGEGPIAEQINGLHKLAKQKYFKYMADFTLRTDLFEKPGMQYSLFL